MTTPKPIDPRADDALAVATTGDGPELPRQCMVILESQRDAHGYIPSLVIENEPGHWPMMGRGPMATPWYWGDTFEEATATAANYNARAYGLSPQDCADIQCSSMFAKLDEHRAAGKVNEPRTLYTRRGMLYSKATRDEVRESALRALDIVDREAIRSPQDTEQFLKVKLGHLSHEVFAVIYLDNRHRVIKFDELFRGTIDGTSVYPREVVKEALQCDAAAVILAHNHPSGIAEPSQADERITKRCKSALELVDIRLLDHLIIGGNNAATSLAGRGLL